MIYIKTENNIITNIVDSSSTTGYEDYVPGFETMCVGQDVRWFNNDGTMKSLSTIVSEGLIEVPPDCKVENNTFVPKTDYDKVLDGSLKLKAGSALDHETKSIVGSTIEETFRQGHITHDEYMELKTSMVRRARDRKLSDLDAAVSNPLRFKRLSEATIEELDQYRTLLLDVPQQPGFPVDVVWPELPALLIK